jgi:glycerol kinase
MTYLLALDQGTSSSRSIVFDADGRIVAWRSASSARSIRSPAGWSTTPRIWQTQLAPRRRRWPGRASGARGGKAIGITNQRETTVVWNRRTGQPIHNAIVWQDRRTEPLCAQLRDQGHAERHPRAHRPGGRRLLLGHQDPLDPRPRARRRTSPPRGELAFGTVDSWLLWKLTGGRVHATDVSNAARTMLFDIRHNAWDHELLKLLHVPDSLLPAVHPSSHVFGETDAALLGAAIPIAGMAGDQQSALFGQACFSAGLAKNTYGTGCFMLMHTGAQFRDQPERPDHHRRGAAGRHARYRAGGQRVHRRRGGAVAARRPARHPAASSEVQALAESVPDAGGVLFVPAFTGLGAPYWDANARGAIVGLTRGSTVAHIARAALESIAFQSAALLQAMAATRRRRHAGDRTARGRRRLRQRPADAVPGRPAGHPGGAAAGHRDHRAGRGLPGRPGHAAVWDHAVRQAWTRPPR